MEGPSGKLAVAVQGEAMDGGAVGPPGVREGWRPVGEAVPGDPAGRS